MPIFQLTEQLAFPHPDLSVEDGLLAIGGDLSVERILLAYSLGIFPWYSEGEPILWWSPDPRMVLLPSEFQVSKRFARALKSDQFIVTFDRSFNEVITACASVPRSGQDGTWITEEMQAAYRELHAAGYAHSVECWQGDTLVGGLYGLSLGQCFFGESMFSLNTDASKTALAALVEKLISWDFRMIDCQVHTPHLERMGARDVPRSEFLILLQQALEAKTHVGSWA